MKCPKCGFNSFEFYDSCKKCSIDLTGYKLTYSIASMILPVEAKEKIAVEFQSAGSTTDRISTTVETRDEIFSFDLPDDSPSAPVLRNDDPFNFDEPSPDVKQSSSSRTENNAFADLLESTPQTDESPFGSAHANVAAAPVKAVEPASGSNEFDLESFSWDDANASTDGKEIDDDFDSLFGDMKEKTHN